MITLTEAALKQFSDQLKNRGRGLGIRIGVKSTGCSGLSYILEFIDEIDTTDDIFNFGNFSIYIDKKSLMYLTGLEIDFVKEGLNEGFKFINPNEKSRCGCGESFTA